MAGKVKPLDGLTFTVTGGSGFVGQRLVEMLIERNAKKVISFDRAPKPDFAIEDSRIEYVVGDITKLDDVMGVCRPGVECVFHIAAAVGPFHPFEVYDAVNHQGTLHVIKACKANGIHKIVMSSSPSTRFDGNDMAGLREDQLKIREPGQFLEPYAETKARGELALRAANDGRADGLMTVAVAPHQVYGPRDALFLPSLLDAGRTGKLRVFGSGNNDVAFTHVDNYSWGIILGYYALYPGSPALAKFYIVTDGGSQKFWRVVDQAITGNGFPSIWNKFKLPLWLLVPLAWILEIIGKFRGERFKLNPFTVRMMTIHRWFDISAATQDLGYKPLLSFAEGWKQTIEWFTQHKLWWMQKASVATKGGRKPPTETKKAA